MTSKTKIILIKTLKHIAAAMIRYILKRRHEKKRD